MNAAMLEASALEIDAKLPDDEGRQPLAVLFGAVGEKGLQVGLDGLVQNRSLGLATGIGGW